MQGEGEGVVKTALGEVGFGARSYKLKKQNIIFPCGEREGITVLTAWEEVSCLQVLSFYLAAGELCTR